MSEDYEDPNNQPTDHARTFQEVLDANPDIHPALKIHLDRLIAAEQQPTDEKITDKQTRFKTHYTSVISTPLTVDTIDTYAQSALSDLIDLSKEITDVYRKTAAGLSHFNNDKDLEDSAYTYFGLPDIPGSLDYIDSVDQDIRRIEKLIDQVQIKDQVFLPPDSPARPIDPGNGERTMHHVLVPRLKTLLFILEKDFNIDIDDVEQIRIEKGVTTDEMMRNESYYAVDVSELNRTVLICDEKGNATFVLDSEKLKNLNLTSEQLLSMTKGEWNSILDNDPNVGISINQSKHWVKTIRDNLMGLKSTELENPDDNESYLTKKQALKYRRPEDRVYPLGDIGSTPDREGLFPVAPATIRRIVDQLGITGKKVVFDSGGIGVGYDSWQINQIRDGLYKRNLIERRPEDRVYSAHELGTKPNKEGLFPLVPSTILTVAKQLGIEGEEVSFGKGKPVMGYDSWQVNQIRDELYRRNLIERRPEDKVYSVNELGSSQNNEGLLPFSGTTITRIAKHLGIEGEKVNLSGAHVGIGYDSWQVNQIRDELYRTNLLERRPEDRVYSAQELGSISGSNKEGIFPVNNNTITNIAKQLGIEGEIVKFGHGPNGIGYDAWQVNQIRDELIKRNLIERQPEDRVYSANDIGSTPDKEGQFPVAPSMIRRLADQLGIEGEKVGFGGRGGMGVGYDSWQVNQIRDELIKRKLIPQSGSL